MSLQKSVPIKLRKKNILGRVVDRSIIISKYKSTFCKVSAMLLICFLGGKRGGGFDQYEDKTSLAVYTKQPSAMTLKQNLSANQLH
jgi:hypothetical protein